MKKDINIPQVSDVFVAVVKEFNPNFNCFDWNAYIINNKLSNLELVLIVSKGYGNTKETSTMRHKIKELPAQSYAKIELLQEDVLKLTNSFTVSYFENNVLFDKKFVFEAGTIKDSALRVIPLLNKKGILLK